MCGRIVYLRREKRRPVWIGTRPWLRDIQADVPAHWCRICGREVYHTGSSLCGRCSAERSV